MAQQHPDMTGTNSSYPFLRGGGEMGSRVRGFDWSATPLGPPESWPQSLKTMVSTLLLSRFPMFLLWGPGYIQIYNDAYVPSFGSGGKHPEALGQQGAECWREAWPLLGPLLDGVRETGEAIWKEDQHVPISRNGRLEDSFWTFSYSPVLDDAGNIGGVLSTCFETTEKVLSLQQLKESEERFRTIFEQAPLGMALVQGRDQVIQVANEGILRIWSRNDSVIGLPLIKALPELEGQPFIGLLEKVYDTGEPYVAYGVRATLARDYVLGNFYFDFTYTPVRDARGAITGVMILTAEVTDRELARRATVESEARFRALVENAPMAICFWRGPQYITEVANDAIISIWGKTRAQVMGKPLREGVPELAGQPFFDILDTIWATGAPYTGRDTPAQLMVDGELRTSYFDFTYQPIFDDNGAIYGIMDIALDVTARVIAQQQKERTQRELLMLFEQSPVAIAILKKEALTFSMANPFYGKLVNRRPEEIVGKPLFEALPEIEGQGFGELLEDVIASGVPFTAPEVAVDIRHGEELDTIYVDLAYQPMREPDGSISGILVVATDQTDQVRSRLKIEANARKLNTLIQSAPVAIGLFSGRELIIETPNQSFVDIIGRGPDIVGKPLAQVMPELESQPFLQLLDNIFTTGESYRSPADKVIIDRNGQLEERYFNVTFSPIFDENGKVCYVLDISVDVTDQVRSRKALEDAEAKLRSAINLAEMGTWTINALTGRTTLSERVAGWYGLPAEADNEAVGRQIPERDIPAVAAAFEKATAPGSDGVFDVEHGIINKQTGQLRIIHAQGIAQLQAGQFTGIVEGASTDITIHRNLQSELAREVQVRTAELEATNAELAILNTELQRSNEELAQYAYVASHDLQEPLRKIQIFADMLRTGDGLQERESALVRRIAQASERMQLLVKDLLGFSRLLQSKELRVPIDLQRIVGEVLQDFDLLIQEKGASVLVGKLPAVTAIRLQMNQLFYNLIGNALKFVQPGRPPRIEIQAVPMSREAVKRHLSKPLSSANYYDITVQDNGIGFASEYAGQIFEVFKRLHTRDAYPGSGIGLALCRRIVANHCGLLYTESEEGKGATFHIILPDQQEEGEFC